MEYDIEKINGLSEFDPKDYLTTPEARKAYLEATHANGTPEQIAAAEKLVAEMELN